MNLIELIKISCIYPSGDFLNRFVQQSRAIASVQGCSVRWILYLKRRPQKHLLPEDTVLLGGTIPTQRLTPTPPYEILTPKLNIRYLLVCTLIINNQRKCNPLKPIHNVNAHFCPVACSKHVRVLICSSCSMLMLAGLNEVECL